MFSYARPTMFNILLVLICCPVSGQIKAIQCSVYGHVAIITIIIATIIIIIALGL